MRDEPEAVVVRWLDEQPSDAVWVTSITLFETRLGLSLLPDGRRRRRLETAFIHLLEEDLNNLGCWILIAGRRTGGGAGCYQAESRASGGCSRHLDSRDCAGALATLATRNLRHLRAWRYPWSVHGATR